MGSPGQVTPEMLAKLVSHYRGGSAPARGSSAHHQSQFRLDFQFFKPLLLQVPGLSGDTTLIGSDGSASDREGVGSAAAVRGDGWALAGVFTGDVITPPTCEAHGVRLALRLASPGDHVLVRLDNTSVISLIYRLLSKGGKIQEGGIRDWDLLNEIRWHVRTRGVHLEMQRIPDAEGGTDSRRIPSDPLMGAAHRLCWSVRRMHLEGVPAEGAALEWLLAAVASGERWTPALKASWSRFRSEQA